MSKQKIAPLAKTTELRMGAENDQRSQISSEDREAWRREVRFVRAQRRSREQR